MLNYNEIKERKYIIHEDQPWEVVTSQVSRKQANKPVNKTKLKNLITGQSIDHTFHVSDKVHEADMARRNVVFQYSKPDRQTDTVEYWFSAENNPGDRFTLDKDVIGDALTFIRERDTVEALIFTDNDGEENIIGIKAPMKVELKVTEAPPNIKGDTATGGSKVVTLENGSTINAPLFINVGDIIRINTEKGEYVERAEKN